MSHTYRIRQGDTLWALSRKFGTSIDALVKANDIKNPNLIITGHTLVIPGRHDGVDAARGTGRQPVALPSSPQDAAQQPPRRPGRRSTPTLPRNPNAGPGKVRLGEVPRGQLAQYEYFKGVVQQAGGKWKTGPNQFNLVALRTNTNTTANGGNGLYDDRLAMVWKDSAGRPHVELLRFNTEPARAMSRYSSDVNGDGVADQGRLPEGYYEYAKSSWKNGFCLRPVRDYQVQRDMNHNGRWDDSRRTGGGGSMLFHQGGSSGTGSAGCQTFPPGEWARFMRLVRDARGSLGYTIVGRQGAGAS